MGAKILPPFHLGYQSPNGEAAQPSRLLRGDRSLPKSPSTFSPALHPLLHLPPGPPSQPARPRGKSQSLSRADSGPVSPMAVLPAMTSPSTKTSAVASTRPRPPASAPAVLKTLAVKSATTPSAPELSAPVTAASCSQPSRISLLIPTVAALETLSERLPAAMVMALPLSEVRRETPRAAARGSQYPTRRRGLRHADSPESSEYDEEDEEEDGIHGSVGNVCGVLKHAFEDSKDHFGGSRLDSEVVRVSRRPSAAAAAAVSRDEEEDEELQCLAGDLVALGMGAPLHRHHNRHQPHQRISNKGDPPVVAVGSFRSAAASAQRHQRPCSRIPRQPMIRFVSGRMYENYYY